MKRDMELIRTLMLHLESLPAGTILGQELKGIEPDGARLAEHLELLRDEDLILGENQGGMMGGADAFVIERITSAGHNFLDAIRSDTIWQKTKKKLLGAGGSVSLALVTQIAEGYVAQALGLPPP